MPAQLKNSLDRKGVLNVPNPRFKLLQKSYAVVLSPCVTCLLINFSLCREWRSWCFSIISLLVLIVLLVLPRFHLLPEFDQGKRSCRRRLAGHNERRRKPPSGSVLSTRHGRFSPSLFGETLPEDVICNTSLIYFLPLTQLNFLS